MIGSKGGERTMSSMRLLAAVFATLIAFCLGDAARAGEWEDYQKSPYSDFRWDWLVRDGHFAYAKGKYKEALGIYEKAVEQGCKDPLMLFRMGYCHRALRKDKDAAGYFAASLDGLKKAYPKHKYNWFSRYYLAEILVRSALIDRAKKELDEAIKLNPKFEQAYLLYGNLYYDEGDYPSAAEKYHLASEANPKSLQAFVNLGAVYDAMGQDEKSVSAYLIAKSLSPRDTKILFSLAGIYAKMKKPEEAMKGYKEILELEPDSEKALVGAGRASWEMGERDKAVEFYQKALGANLQSYEALLGLGLAMLEAEDLEKAEDYLRKSLEVKPDSKEAHYNLGVLHQSKGDFDAAIKEFVRAIEIDSEDETCYYNVGLSFVKAGLYEQAREWLSKAVEKFGKESKWSKADLKLLELIDRLEAGKETEIEKELKKAMEDGEQPTPE
jgi:tetratricopeptide (TPR) repeat protein